MCSTVSKALSQLPLDLKPSGLQFQLLGHHGSKVLLSVAYSMLSCVCVFVTGFVSLNLFAFLLIKSDLMMISVPLIRGHPEIMNCTDVRC